MSKCTEYFVALQEPLLFSRCVYKNLRLRVSNKSRAQTLQILEQAADRHRIGSCMYMHAAKKLKSDAYHVHDLMGNAKHSQRTTSVPHIKLLARITEPDITARLRMWSEEQQRHALLL